MAVSEEEKKNMLPLPVSTTSKDENDNNILNIIYAITNISSSILIIMCNKIVFSNYKFNFGITLTLIHFIVTYLGLALAAGFGVFTPKRLDYWEVLPLALSFCGFVVLTNLSLQYNTVGIYQIAKVMTTPCVILIQFVWYGKRVSLATLLAVSVTCIGVMIVSVTDVSVNTQGSIYAISGVVVTALYQIWVGTKQKELSCNSMQLLLYQAPMSSFLLFISLPWLEDIKSLVTYRMTFAAAMAIFGSALLALIVNLSIFLIIGKMSAVTYNMIGHLKLCTVLILGYIFFDSIPNGKSIFGIILTFMGVVSYSMIPK